MGRNSSKTTSVEATHYTYSTDYSSPCQIHAIFSRPRKAGQRRDPSQPTDPEMDRERLPFSVTDLSNISLDLVYLQAQYMFSISVSLTVSSVTRPHSHHPHATDPSVFTAAMPAVCEHAPGGTQTDYSSVASHTPTSQAALEGSDNPITKGRLAPLSKFFTAKEIH